MQKAAPETVHEFLRNFFVAREKTVPRIKSHPTKTRGRWTSTRISLESISSYLSAVCHSSNNARYRRQIFKKTKRRKKFADDKISSIDRLTFFRKYIIFGNIKYQYFFVSKFRNLMNLLFRIYYFEGKERFIKGKIQDLKLKYQSSICKEAPFRKHRHRPLRRGPKKSYNHKSYSQGWMQFRRGCWSRLQGHWTQDRPSFFLNLPTVNIPIRSTGQFSNEFNNLTI